MGSKHEIEHQYKDHSQRAALRDYVYANQPAYP